jgi:hypothetical protein
MVLHNMTSEASNKEQKRQPHVSRGEGRLPEGVPLRVYTLHTFIVPTGEEGQIAVDTPNSVL